MAFEIELKVRVDDCTAVKERLAGLGNYCRAYTKSDSYWIHGKNQHGETVRIRHESGIGANGETHEAVLVTYKIKSIAAGIEVNDEREFTVSDRALFEALLTRLGLSSDICKEKQGWAWIMPAETAEKPAILAELSMVTGLGWFLELEIIADDNHEQTVAVHRKQLLALLTRLGIPAEHIEPRPYTTMLRT
ncbi:MAG: CYTH domain-containing protein [Treponema sp.]|nr:CYTH domain-containing protein [Treponema sp.]